MNPQDPASDRVLTWAALLAKWTEFARAGVALPADAEGERWRESIAPAITLHAASLALDDLGSLDDPEEIATGVDRGEVLIRDAVRSLHQTWYATSREPGSAARVAETMPSEILRAIEDAQRALERAHARGVEWVVTAHRLAAPDFVPEARRRVEAGFMGEMLAPEEGTILRRGTPLLFLRGGGADLSVEGASPRQSATPRQVYRQVGEDPESGVVDLVAPLLDVLPPGRPLLTPLVQDGRVVREADPDEAERWRITQEALFAERGDPRVEHWRPSTDERDA